MRDSGCDMFCPMHELTRYPEHLHDNEHTFCWLWILQRHENTNVMSFTHTHTHMFSTCIPVVFVSCGGAGTGTTGVLDGTLLEFDDGADMFPTPEGVGTVPDDGVE